MRRSTVADHGQPTDQGAIGYHGRPMASGARSTASRGVMRKACLSLNLAKDPNNVIAGCRLRLPSPRSNTDPDIDHVDLRLRRDAIRSIAVRAHHHLRNQSARGAAAGVTTTSPTPVTDHDDPRDRTVYPSNRYTVRHSPLSPAVRPDPFEDRPARPRRRAGSLADLGRDTIVVAPPQ